MGIVKPSTFLIPVNSLSFAVHDKSKGCRVRNSLGVALFNSFNFQELGGSNLVDKYQTTFCVAIGEWKWFLVTKLLCFRVEKGVNVLFTVKKRAQSSER